MSKVMFETQKGLLSELFNRVSGSFVSGNNPSDLGYFGQLKTTKSSLSLTVSRADIISQAIIDSANVDLLKVGEEVSFGVEGSFIADILKKNGAVGSCRMEIETLKKKEEGEEETDGPTESYSWDLYLAGYTRKEQKWSSTATDFSCPKIEEKAAKKLVISGKDFVECVKTLKIAVGQDNGNTMYRNIKIRCGKKKGTVEMATLTDKQLAVAEITPVSIDDGFDILIQYDILAIAAKQINQTQDVTIQINEGTQNSITCIQDLKYAGNVVGKVKFLINCSSDKFPKFEKIVGGLSFNYVAKAKSDLLKNVVSQASLIGDIKLDLFLDKKNSVMSIRKKSGKRNADGLEVPLVECSEDFSIEVSYEFLKDCVEKIADEEAVMEFSGLQSLVHIKLKDGVDTYFMPFGPVKG